MTTESLSGEIRKNGQTGRVYIFGFGWACRYNLEALYGEGLAQIAEEKDHARLVANVLMCGLKARQANNLPDTFERKQMYELLDDIGEQGVDEVWKVGKQAMGFINRLMGLSDEEVEKLTQPAPQNVGPDPSLPTGQDS